MNISHNLVDSRSDELTVSWTECTRDLCRYDILVYILILMLMVPTPEN